VRELKNIADQVSVLSQDKQISSKELGKFLQPYSANRLPVLAHANGGVQKVLQTKEKFFTSFSLI
jgi:hypothetical protein